MDELTIVSADSHATVPPDLWTEYLDPEFHDLLPRLEAENVVWPSAMWWLSSYALTFPGLLEEHQNGSPGAYDADTRLAEMDREGIAAEVVYHGDFRTSDMFHTVSNDVYSLEAWEAGALAYNRWAAEALGARSDRFLLVGAIGPCTRIDRAVAEIEWLAAHGFVGTYAPGFMTHPDLPPLFDSYWEPFWAACESQGIAVVVHAGYGFGQGAIFPEVERIYRQVEEGGGGKTDFVGLVAESPVFGNFFADIKARRAMWQIMLGGAFDRHPDLKLLMSEVRLDWVPTLLEVLDRAFADNRHQVAAERRPSDYWQTNCMAGASFVHRAEVQMRQEIGVEQIAFGRDYPHPEGTWPHTADWLRDAFEGVPDDELRLMLGGNLVRFLGLDATRLDEIAGRVGPTRALLAGTSDPELLASFDLRGGYLKPAERDERLPEMQTMLQGDLELVVHVRP